MGRTTSRSGRHNVGRDLGAWTDVPPWRSRAQHRLRLAVGAVVATLAVLLLMPLLAAQEVLKRRRGRLLTLLVLLALGAGALLREAPEAPAPITPTRHLDELEPRLLVEYPPLSGTLSGRVLDRDGAPLSGAVIRLLRGERHAREVLADANGEWATGLIDAGPVTLEVARPGEGLPAVRTGVLVMGHDTRVELRVPEPAGLQVVVVGPDGAVEGCEVRVVDPLVTRYGSYPRSAVQPTRPTDVGGVARFEGLPPGRYFVRARVPDRSAPLLGHVDLQPGGAGRVVLDATTTRTLTVRVVDPAGAPVPGVFMDVSMPGINWSGMPSAVTGADGVAVLDDLPAGLAEVHLGQGDLWRMVRTRGDEAVVVWTPATSIDLRGRVAGLEGEVLVAYVLPDVVHVTYARVQAERLEATITPPAGGAQVFLVAPNPALAPIHLGAVTDGQRSLEVDATFTTGKRVTGRIVDAATGQGVPGRVRVRGALAGALEAQAQWLGDVANDEWITVNEWSVATDADGHLELAGLPDGAWEVEVEAVGGQPTTFGVHTTASAPFVHDFGDVAVEPR